MQISKILLKFSQQFVNRIGEMRSSDYELKAAKVNFIVPWTKEETGQEVRVIMSGLLFEQISTA